MDDSRKILVIFLVILGFFPIFYIFMPVYVIFGASVVVTVIAVFQAIKTKEYEFVIPLLAFSIISAIFVVRYTQSMSLLLVSEAVDIAQGAALVHVIVLFVEYFPIFLVFGGAFAIMYAWGFVMPGRKFISLYARSIGYVGIVLMLTFVYLDMMVWSVSGSDVDDLASVFFEVVLMGNPLVITFELWYFIQFSIWVMSTYMFVTGFLLTLTGAE